MALTVTIVGKRNIGDRRAQLVDFVFTDSDSGGEDFVAEDAALHAVDAVLPEPNGDSGIFSVAFDRGNDLLFLTDAAVAVTNSTATVRALVVGI